MSEEIESKEEQIRQINMEAKNNTDFTAEGERFCKALDNILSYAGGFNRKVVDTLVDLILVKTESTKEIVYLDVYLRNQNFDDPTRFAKTEAGLLLFRDKNEGARKIQEFSSDFSSIIVSPEHWPQHDRSEKTDSNGPIFMPKKDWWWF